MQVSAQELDWLNFYRASELHGGLVLGQLALRVRDGELMAQLTRHSAEEVVHAQLWADTILEVGGTLRPVRRTYQARYADEIGAIGSMFQVLALTQVFERRVYRHFIEHARRPGTHAAVRATLERMVEEEKHHLSWVKHWLDEQSLKRPDVVRQTMEDYVALDNRVYQSVVRDYGYAAAATPAAGPPARVAAEAAAAVAAAMAAAAAECAA
jgi:demethoxyubiquinone hydroxylase (CLK1/Coq7/Cat5 family)